MAVGDLTATITVCETTAAIKTYLDTQNSGAATAGADTTSFQVVPIVGTPNKYIVVKVARAAA